jgi:hypothetical protein
MTLIACNKDGPISPSGSDTQSVSAFLVDNNGLIISILTDDETDETYYFEDYKFNFNSDGSVVATDANEAISGTYSIFLDDGIIELRINFPNIQNVNELNDDWSFISINQNTIRFDDDGDMLEFQQQ